MAEDNAEKKQNDNLIIQEPGKSYFNLQAWKAMEGMAKVFIASGAMPKHIQNGSQLMVIMQTGRELGMMPMESVNSLYIINGRVAMQSQAMLTKVLGSGIKLQWLEETDKKCVVKFSGLGRPDYISTFTIEEATQAGLTSKGGPWKQYPKIMLRWRALALGARVFCPDVIQGLHTVEELANVDLKMTDSGVFEPVDKTPPNAQNRPSQTTQPQKPVNTAPPLSAANDRPSGPSKAQGEFLIKLCKQKGIPEEDPMKYTRESISKRIDELKAMPDKAIEGEVVQPGLIN